MAAVAQRTARLQQSISCRIRISSGRLGLAVCRRVLFGTISQQPTLAGRYGSAIPDVPCFGSSQPRIVTNLPGHVFVVGERPSPERLRGCSNPRRALRCFADGLPVSDHAGQHLRSLESRLAAPQRTARLRQSTSGPTIDVEAHDCDQCDKLLAQPPQRTVLLRQSKVHPKRT